MQGESPGGQLLHERVLEGQVVLAIDEQLFLEVLRRVEVLARRLLAVTPALRREESVG